jgi:uncharacterized membrane protein YbjE (DUF340 family)
MSTFGSLFLLLVFLSFGFFATRMRMLPSSRYTGLLFSTALYLLLFSMGLRLGQSREVLSRLPTVGALATVGMLFTSGGTLLLHALMSPVYRRLAIVGAIAGSAPIAQTLLDGHNSVPEAPCRRPKIQVTSLLGSLKAPLLLLVLLLLGTGLGHLLPEILAVRDGTAGRWILQVLLFVIGMQMAETRISVWKLLLQPTTLLLPLVTLVGTLVGSLGTLAFDGMTTGKALALGSGFGWYSLSGAIISEHGDPALGTAALLSNLLREALAFILIPLLKRTGRCESGIGLAGATSMDVALPVLEGVWGAQIVPLSVAHGVVLSLLVPVLVPLFMGL